MKSYNKNIPAMYPDIKAHIASDKSIPSPFVVSEHKRGHRSSYYKSEPVVAAMPLGTCTVECEVRQGEPFNYSFSYSTDLLDSRQIARLDTGDGTHNNRLPDIPLEESQVPTPHIHLYREDGHAIAYPIPGVDYSSEASTKFDYQQGFDYFCQTLNISDPLLKGLPLFEYRPDGILVFPPMDADSDPNAGIDFDSSY